ncbi:hypothetical protein [Streptomyces sp. 2A115]|uniref:hypothetical protein n=1 Tax=Streptomyces sp. 2A115 TaxID=3457439 RepID=UPI003FD65272
MRRSLTRTSERALGARTTALVLSAETARRATEAGAAGIIDLSSRNFDEAIAGLTDGQRDDLALDPSAVRGWATC